MIFKQIKTDLQTLLNTGAVAGGYQVLGYQREIRNVEEILDGNRTVQVFYAAGQFPKNKGSINGPVHHDLTFRLELYVSKRAEGDLASLEGAADDAARALALASFKHAAEVVDDSMDDLIDKIYTLIMNTENRDFARTLPAGVIADRWVTGIQKDSPIGDGEFAGLTALITLTCSAVEDLAGAEGLAMTEAMDASLGVNQNRDITPATEAAPIAGQLLATPE